MANIEYFANEVKTEQDAVQSALCAERKYEKSTKEHLYVC